MAVTRALVLLILAAFAPLGAAAEDAPAPPPLPAPTTIQGYGKANRACIIWTNGCAVCRRFEYGELTCSNIGIACIATEIKCSLRDPDWP